MSSKKFDIKYGQEDFFYNTSDKTKNDNVLRTFPFKREALINWANTKITNGSPQIPSDTDIFDPRISSIILNPVNDFKNSFLKGNMTFNDSFNKITFDLINPPVSNTQLSESAEINGNVTLVSNDPKQNITLDVNSGSAINWTQDSTNSWQPNFNLETNLSQDIPFTFTDTDGGTSSVTITTDNPRCKYRKTCTIKHWHYRDGCQTQIIKDNQTGSTTCKCICTGDPVFDGSPHSHCDPYNINADGTGTTAVGTDSTPQGLGLSQIIKTIKMNLTANFPKPQFGSSGENVTLDYKNIDTLKKNDEQIRDMVFEYYKKVNENIQLQKNMSTRQNKDVTMSQSVMDATVQYKTEYLNVFNIIAGIFCVSGYIYIMGKK
jgi:hypothetical protein